jgi:hypothetical protein
MISVQVCTTILAINNPAKYLWVSYDSQTTQHLFPLNSINQLIFVMENFYVLFAIGTEFF